MSAVVKPWVFDPVAVGRSECDTWAAYYRRDWPRFLVGAVGMVRHGFGLGPLRAPEAAWYVLRANQAWAPYPDNDPERARTLMRHFYALVSKDASMRLDPVRAAAFEVEWWRVHRERQRASRASEAQLAGALVDLYSYVYDTPRAPLAEAAARRVLAMRHSDEWVAAGCPDDHPLIDHERAELVASYTALLSAVRR